MLSKHMSNHDLRHFTKVYKKEKSKFSEQQIGDRIFYKKDMYINRLKIRIQFTTLC